jgi:hypothetical protein
METDAIKEAGPTNRLEDPLDSDDCCRQVSDHWQGLCRQGAAIRGRVTQPRI